MREDELTRRFRCSMRWEDLEGEGPRRRCARCDQDVIDLSAISEAAARAALADGQERCVRYRVRPDRRLRHAPRVSLAALLGALLAGPAQAEEDDPPEHAPRAFVFNDEDTEFIGGAVQKPQLHVTLLPPDASLPPEVLAALDVITQEPPPPWHLPARIRRLRARWILQGGPISVAD